MDERLRGILWSALSGAQRGFAVGSERARRYAPGFSALIGFADPLQPDLDGLRGFCEPGEHFYTDGWSGPAPAGWRIEQEATMVKMLWEGELPASGAAPEAVRLGSGHVTQALALTGLTRPGPFGPRTIELGEYLGILDQGQLLAMAGERMFDGRLREISGVCTHPDHQGRGLARRLMLALIRHQVLRGETPFLHVMSANTAARQLYERMGFRTRLESVVRVVAPH